MPGGLEGLRVSDLGPSPQSGASSLASDATLESSLYLPEPSELRSSTLLAAVRTE